MDLAQFRKEKDDFFRSPDSPLKPEDRQTFSGLAYFPENEALRFSLTLELSSDSSPVILQTSTGTRRSYQRAGIIHFTINGQPAELTVFQDEQGYFLPFRDTTGQDTTYGAGRYLEPEEHNGKLQVDFNLAYNPYCAYNEHYSCPIPPAENRLAVRIEAGERKFHV